MTEVDAARLITADLATDRRARAQHFRAAAVLAVVAPGLVLFAVGARPDLLAQPPWILALQLLVWALALAALPALGLGLWFPRRAARIVLGLAAALAGLVVALGPALLDMSHEAMFDHGLACASLTLALGALLLAICAVSGAFAQRRRRVAALWLAAAVALVGVDTIAWHCPVTDTGHTVTGHLGAGVVTLLIAGLVGAALHRRQRG